MASGGQRAWALLGRHPRAVDAAVALAFAAAALVSADLVYDDVRQFDPTVSVPGMAAIAVAVLATTLPLAGRRRSPLLVALVTCGALVFGRVVLDVNEAAVTVLACYLAIYSAALHGRSPARTPVVAAASALVMAEVVRELYFVGPVSEAPGGLQGFFLAYNAAILVLPWWLGAATRARQRREVDLVSRTAELQRERGERPAGGVRGAGADRP